AGDGFSLALLKNGTVVGWGRGGIGELGNGLGESSDVPVHVSGLSGVKTIAASEGASMALLDDGTVMTWGSNYHGQLGTGSHEIQSDVPVAVPGLHEVTAI